MAKVFPFSAYLPSAEDAPRIASLPYDVMSRAEAREIAGENPLSFLRVTLSDLELPDEVSSYDPQVYELAAKNWQELSAKALTPDPVPSYYVYSLVMNGRRQSGIVACASVEDYRAGIVRKHERTRQVKEDDRTRHILSVRAQTGAVFLTFKDLPALNQVIEDTMAQEAPLFSFTAEDGISHAGWRIPAAKTAMVTAAFESVPLLYIADGHHRGAGAARAAQELGNAGECMGFLSVIFPESALAILPYNRVVTDLNGMESAEFLQRLAAVGEIREGAPAQPAAAGEVSFYLDGKWRTLVFRERHEGSPVEALDVSLLQEQVLEPLLGIQDPRTSSRIDFVGGIRGTAELEKRVDSGRDRIAFSMFPTSLEQLMQVADQNGIMPPKSTWFEPKLRDGLFTHVI